MNKDFLKSPFPPDLADLSPKEGPDLAANSRAYGFVVLELDGARMKSKPALMKHAAQALAFPGDFGENWDALVDYLGDLANVRNKDKILVFIRNSREILAADPRLYSELRNACALACENAREWSRNSVILKFAFMP
ncbi:MAG TPA: hypothetical protein DCZ92_08440 [Elusimicrobia bacterium]|nr:MAG: hypothetical protein A2016_12700 [Elusimicrobia bacterium GWF2_62_30]HBA60833.1 hypothetical protein [Elusimicrobiota bacterium]